VLKFDSVPTVETALIAHNHCPLTDPLIPDSAEMTEALAPGSYLITSTVPNVDGSPTCGEGSIWIDTGDIAICRSDAWVDLD